MSRSAGNEPLPRAIAVVSDQEYRTILQHPDDVERLEDLEAMVIPYSIRPEVISGPVSAARDLLRLSGQLASGSLLVQDPYDSESYTTASEAIETFAVAKYHHLAIVASLLGAREVRVTDAKVERKTLETRGGAKAGVKGVGIEADLSSEFASELAAQLTLETEFEGSDPDPDEALSYLRKHNLLGEHAMTALVAMRRGRNPVLRYQMTLDTTKESQRNIKSALKLATALPDLVELGSNFSRTSGAVESAKITTEILFPRENEDRAS